MNKLIHHAFILYERKIAANSLFLYNNGRIIIQEDKQGNISEIKRVLDIKEDITGLLVYHDFSCNISTYSHAFPEKEIIAQIVKYNIECPIVITNIYETFRYISDTFWPCVIMEEKGYNLACEDDSLGCKMKHNLNEITWYSKTIMDEQEKISNTFNNIDDVYVRTLLKIRKHYKKDGTIDIKDFDLNNDNDLNRGFKYLFPLKKIASEIEL